jgi:hypothetical protein
MTKQTQAHISPEEKPTVDLLRRRFKLQDEYVQSIRKDNIDAGVDSRYLDNLVQWRGDEFIERKRVEMFIAQATDKKRPGHFWQISNLKNRGFIPEDEVSEYENKTYPFRKVNSIAKRKTPDGRLFLQRFETWFALDVNGQEIHKSFDFLDFISKPRIEYDRIPVNPQDPQGPTARVKIVRNPDNHENNLVREYITPWSKETFDQVLSYSVNDDGTKPSFILIHPQYPNPVSAIYEQMLEDFDSTFENIRRPAPDFKDIFTNEMKKRAKEAAEVEEHPYG